jgi:hypothetical protein
MREESWRYALSVSPPKFGSRFSAKAAPLAVHRAADEHDIVGQVIRPNGGIVI